MTTTFDKNDHFTTALSQNGFTLTMNSECGSYYPQISGDLEAGMAFAISSWGDPSINMSWLDGDTGCQESCDNAPSLYISNIKITTGGSGPGPTPPPPPPTPGNYDYGNDCGTLHDDDCA